MDTIKLAQRLYAFGKIDKEAYQRILGNQELLNIETEKKAAIPIGPGLQLAKSITRFIKRGPLKPRSIFAGETISQTTKRKIDAATLEKIIREGERAGLQSEEMKRRMASPEWKKVVGKGLQWALGVGGVGAAAVGAQKVWQFAGIRRSYSNMFNHYPELREYAESEVKKRFTSLARYAPDVMADPMVAGGYMSHAMRYEKFDPTLIPKIMDIQSGIDRAKLLGRTVPEKALGAMAAKIPFPEL